MVKVVETQTEGKLLEHQDLEPPQYSKVQIQEANKETTREENPPTDNEGEEMEIGELGLEGLERHVQLKSWIIFLHNRSPF